MRRFLRMFNFSIVTLFVSVILNFMQTDKNLDNFLYLVTSSSGHMKIGVPWVRPIRCYALLNPSLRHCKVAHKIPFQCPSKSAETLLVFFNSL
jgi:hypothetical protein